MKGETYFSRMNRIVMEARNKIEELKDSNIDWSDFDGTITVYDHFTGEPLNIYIDGISEGRIIVGKDSVSEAGETVSLSDVEDISACILADYMINKFHSLQFILL